MTAGRSPLVDIQALGGLTVRLAGVDGPPVLTQPRHLAVLAYLTLARPRGLHSRDILVALFWPEVDQARARHGLRNALHAIRQALGSELIVAAGDGFVGVDRGLIRCDVLECETDLAAGRGRAALERWRGELLRGFYLSDAPQFERWLDDERRGLLHDLVTAGRTEIATARKGGDLKSALRVAYQTSALVPTDESALHEVMRLNWELGDGGAALREYHAFAKRIRDELGAEPSLETRNLAAEIQQRPRGNSSQAGLAGPSAEPSAPIPEPTGHRMAESPAAPTKPTALRRWSLAIGVAVLAGLGAVWWRDRPTPPPSLPGRIRVAVLPFKSLSSADSQYFADGVTASLRNDLARLEGIDVIAGTSADSYRDSLPATIRRVLGADYLVRGSVQWPSGAAASPAVRVVPELIDVRSGNGILRPQGPVDATPGNWFAAQTDIARQVADSLGVPLRAEAALQMSRPPTRDLHAYEAYLRGNLDQAIALDSTFAQAWAKRAVGLAFQFRANPRTESRRIVAQAVERGLALRPDLMEPHFAAGLFYRYDGDVRRGLAEMLEAKRLAPGSAEVAHFLAAEWWILGRYDEGLAEAQRAVSLDPRNSSAWARLGRIQLWLRDYDQSLLNQIRGAELPQEGCNLAIPDMHWHGVAKGDLSKAYRVIPSVAPEQRAPCAAFVATRVLSPWFLDDAWQDSAVARLRAMGAPEEAYLTAAMVAFFRLDSTRARLLADSAARRLRILAAELPGTDFYRTGLAFAAAILGRADEARSASDAAIAIRNPGTDAFEGPLYGILHAEIAATIGDRDRALRLIRPLLPPARGLLTPGWLRVDPWLAPLRTDPEFRKLAELDSP